MRPRPCPALLSVLARDHFHLESWATPLSPPECLQGCLLQGGPLRSPTLSHSHSHSHILPPCTFPVFFPLLPLLENIIASSWNVPYTSTPLSTPLGNVSCLENQSNKYFLSAYSMPALFSVLEISEQGGGPALGGSLLQEETERTSP